jgi:hypothetical protein
MKPEIQKKLVVGTCHITQEDNESLCNFSEVMIVKASSPIVRDFRYGYDVYIDPEAPLERWEQASDHLRTLIMMAWAAGCHWLTLDADAEKINGLPTFDW